MNQYCRYCAEAIDYNGEGTDFVCNAKAPCGCNGAGQFYPASKAKRINKCKSFEFNEIDVFGFDCEKIYKPRLKTEKPAKFEQIELEGEIMVNKYQAAIAELQARAGRTLKTPLSVETARLAVEAMEKQAELENICCENCKHIRFNDNFHWCGCVAGLDGNRKLTDHCSYFKLKENENG